MKWIRSVMLFVAGIVVGAVVTQSVAAQQNRTTGHRLNHVGIRVTNFEESLKFYTQVMGFKEAYRFPSPDGRPSTTFLQVNRDTFIEMAPPDGKQPAGLTHIGLYSDDAQASVTQFRQAGGTATDPRPSENSGSRLANVTDPSGIRIEINEQPAGSLMRKAMESWK
jgi:catechol 2,3-dioxygenase-like lactoylglutathione lyase family enzyme